MERTLQLMGFDVIFSKLIHTCVSTSSVLVVVEGSPSRVFHPKHGLRQGGPLSPLLFVVVLEILSRKLHHAVEELELFTMGGAVVESHLSY